MKTIESFGISMIVEEVEVEVEVEEEEEEEEGEDPKVESRGSVLL